MEFLKLFKLKNLYQPSAIKSNPTLRNHSVSNNWGKWLKSMPFKDPSTSNSMNGVLHDASIEFVPKFVFTQNSWRSAIGRRTENLNEVPTFEILKSRVFQLSICRDWLFLNPSNSGARLNPFSIHNAGISVERLQDDVFRALFPFSHILPTLFDEEIDFHLDRLFDEEAERRRIIRDEFLACRPMRSFPFYHLGHVDYEFTPFPFNHLFFLSNMQNCYAFNWERRAKKRMVEEHRHQIFSSFVSHSPLPPYHLPLPFLFPQTEVERVHGRFELKERLGKGSFGVVHRVIDTRTGKDYACKSFPKKQCRERSEAEKMKKEIEREKAVMEKVNCAFVVGLEMVVEDSIGVHRIMELCRGGSLGDMMKVMSCHGMLHEEVVKSVVLSLMSALNYCHAMGVMHSDIKPDNVLMTTRFGYDVDLPEYKLADFGAGLVHTKDGWEDCRVGTKGYLAPECGMGFKFDQAADLWSVGAMMYEMLVGWIPYQGSTFEEVAMCVYAQPLDLVTAPWDGVSDEAKDLVRALLSPEPAKRLRLGDVMSHPWITGGQPAWVDPNIIFNDEIASTFRLY